MNNIQLSIIGVIVGVIVLIIAYHLYQENKFKKRVDSNFNQATNDALQESSSLIFENQQPEHMSLAINNRDVIEKIDLPKIVNSDTKDIQVNEFNFDNNIRIDTEIDSKFVKYDQITFPYQQQISDAYHHVIDIYFTKPAKIKMFPDLSQFSSKSIQYFILDKNGWAIFERNKKYLAEGVKVVVDLVDTEGCIYPLQVANIFNELNMFANHHQANIRQRDCELEIRRIQQQLKNLSSAVLELELFMVNKETLGYNELSKYFLSNGFVNNRGVFELRSNNSTMLYVANEDGARFEESGSYRIFSINSKLHHQENPMQAMNKIFDVAEHYMQYFESRLLTSNKLVMSERDFSTLERQVSSYINNCKRQGITLGSELIARVYP